MIILFAPVLSLAALITGGAATIVAIFLNGPRRLRRREPASVVLLPPVPCPGMPDPDDDLEGARAG